ncbi:MAG: hypothetical protein KDD62_08915, partial [Bdellovibrionales bacterium]|nr:hypothetical protein [Bdellovibrionales bacterium]
MLGTLRQCFATVAVFTLSACASQRAPIAPGVVPTQQSSEITASDIRYGEQVLQAFKSQFPISHDAQTLVRLREVVEKLADGAGAGGSGWQIYLFEGD